MSILASHLSIASAPFEVGVASAVMSVRAYTRRCMEDFYHCEWPLCGPNEVCPYLTPQSMRICRCSLMVLSHSIHLFWVKFLCKLLLLFFSHPRLPMVFA